MKRRSFLQAGAALAAAPLGCAMSLVPGSGRRDYDISVATWSLHRAIGGGELTMLDVPRLLREEFDIGGIEYVNSLMAEPTAAYLADLRKRCEGHGVVSVLIMVDGQGALGAADAGARTDAVQRHADWLRIAGDLGCHAIRVNWAGAEKDTEHDPARAAEFIARSTDAYRQLCDIAAANSMHVIIENHWGPSSYPDLTIALMEAVDHPSFGTLPDFGNFPDAVNRYEATDRMMPYARAVSAKCYDFGDDGRETKIDFARMLEICCDKHGYDGWIGIEYEGNRLSENEGIHAAKRLLEGLRTP